MPKALFYAVLVSAAAAALWLRVHELELRPMHGDEANQAVKTGQLLETGVYVYDPHDHHGPTLYYLALIPAKLAGATALADLTPRLVRIVPVVFGVASILALGLFAGGLGRWAVLWAAALLTLSPAAVFYSRYFIQETLLVFFTVLLLGAGWRYCVAPRALWAVVAGMAIGLMHATKETCILTFAAMAGGLICTIAWNRWRDGRVWVWRAAVSPKHLVWAAATAAAVSITLFTSFFSHGRGPIDSVLTYFNYIQRADGAGLHQQPWYYYLALLAYTKKGFGPFWTEALILALACIGAAFALLRPSAGSCSIDLPRFLTFYTVLLTAVYSSIPYKTPWSMLSFHMGMILLAGFGAASLVGSLRWRPLQGVAILGIIAGLYHLGQQTWRANIDYPADPRNPYVYAHTSTAFMRLAERLEDLSAVHPQGNAMMIAVVVPTGDYWPIPWYTRQFLRVGYYDRIDDVPDGAVIIASPQLHDAIEERLGGQYRQEFHGLRPGVLLHAWIPEELWDAFIASRSGGPPGP